MNPRLLVNLRGFLGRTQLSGTEVPAFVEVLRWLDGVEAQLRAAAEPGDGIPSSAGD